MMWIVSRMNFNVVPTIYDETLNVKKLVNLVENRLLKLMHMKQLHSCEKNVIKLDMVANMVSHML